MCWTVFVLLVCVNPFDYMCEAVKVIFSDCIHLREGTSQRALLESNEWSGNFIKCMNETKAVGSNPGFHNNTQV